jgi:3-hydroxybutyryl-CoA dehydratase
VPRACGSTRRAVRGRIPLAFAKGARMDMLLEAPAPTRTALERLRLGRTASHTQTVTTADIEAFARLSGDSNPIHPDENDARTSRFGGRIAHGMPAASLVSAVLGTELPGPGAIYLARSLAFRAPVRSGDTVRAAVTVKEIRPEKRRVVLATVCAVGERIVVEGEATLLVPD